MVTIMHNETRDFPYYRNHTFQGFFQRYIYSYPYCEEYTNEDLAPIYQKGEHCHIKTSP